jgi:PAS domain S-box-containing protein
MKRRNTVVHEFPQSVIDGIVNPIMAIDTDYRVLLMNRAAREFSSPGALAPEPYLCYQLSHRRETPCDGNEHPCPLEEVRDSGRPVTVVHEHFWANGERRVVEVMAAPFLGADGAFLGIIESIVDITERELAQDELARLRKAVETAGEVIFLTDRGGIITYVNPEFTRLYGYAAERVVGKTTPRILKSEMMTPRDYELFWQTLLSRRVVKGEIINRCKDGSFVTVEGSASPIIDENDAIVGFLAIQRDITARKQAEETLQQYADRLRALSAQIADVTETERQQLALELHDQVGQNLSALGINLNIVRSQMPEQTTTAVRSRLDDSLSLLEQTAERIRDVMADLRPPVLDDYGLVAALHWYGERLTRRTDVVVSVEGDESIPRLAPRVENALFRIAQEALTNVVKHAQATQVAVTVTVDRETLCLSVADDGIGLDPAVLAEPDQWHGWGLLTMIERAEAVGGRCRIESDPGHGTRVIVEVDR